MIDVDELDKTYMLPQKMQDAGFKLSPSYNGLCQQTGCYQAGYMIILPNGENGPVLQDGFLNISSTHRVFAGDSRDGIRLLVKTGSTSCLYGASIGVEESHDFWTWEYVG